MLLLWCSVEKGKWVSRRRRGKEEVLTEVVELQKR